MNDENDHDQGTEHFEKGPVIDKIKGFVSGASSAKGKGEDGVANAGSATEASSDTADGEVGRAETIKPIPTEGGKGGKSQKKQGGFFQGIKDDFDYKKYQNLANNRRYSTERPIGRDNVDEGTGDPSWKAHYEELKGRKKERDAFAEEYRKHTGRDFDAEGSWGDVIEWYDYDWRYGPNGDWRGENGEIDWDGVNRKIAQGYLTNYAQGEMSEDYEGWISPDQHAASYRGHHTDEDVENELREKFGVTDEQIQEAYRQVRETGRVDPALFRDKDTSPQEAEQAAEEIEQQAHDAEGGAVFPGGTGEGEDGGKGGKGGPTGEENPDILSEKRGSVLDDGAESRQQKEWKPSVTSQRMMDAGVAGLNMFGNVLGGANKAFSMLRGLASALTSRQLMSDPTLPARGFLNAMDQSGQIIEDHIRQVGEAYGIKDGVKREDLVGTYKGAQYYREKQRIEDAEKQYYAGVGNALSTVLGNNVNVNDPVSIQNALAQMGPAQLSQLDDALFGQNGTLRDMYDATVTNPMGSTKEQRARAQLFTTLNQALKGQAQANAREAGRARTQTNQQIQQYNQENRQIRMDQEADKAEAIRRMTSPDMMPQSNADQMATVFNAILGDEVRNKKVRVRTWGNNTWVDPKDLNSTQLKALKRGMEDHPELLTDPRTRGVRALYDEVNARLGDIDQFKQDEAQAKIDAELDPIKNSPLDMDMRGPEVRRDEYGIPETTGRRNQLRDSAREMKAKLESEGGSADDIALCDNVILMCDMAEMRQGVFADVQKMETNGIISPMDAEMIRSEARAAYRDLADDLALSVAERDRMAQAGEDWQSTGRFEVTAHQLNLRGAKEYSDSIQAEYKQGLKDARDQERQRRKQQEEIDKAARKARMTEQEKEAAQFDGRGIPLCPDNGPRDKCRKSLNASLTQIEIMLENIPDTPENAYRRSALAVAKRETEKQLMRLDQEDHIQKMIQDARVKGMGDEANAKAKELRDRYYDWEEFGKALNDIRENELGLNGDRAWRSTQARQRAQAVQSQNKAMIEAMKNLTDALNGQPDAMRDMMKDFMKDKDVLKTVKDILHENNVDLKHLIIGKGNIKMHGVVVNAIRDALNKNMQKKITGMFETAVSNALGPVTDGLTKVQESVSTLGDAQKSGIISAVNGVNASVSGLKNMFTQCLTDSATGQPIKVAELRDSLNGYMESNKDLIQKLNEKIPLGGTNDDKYGIPPEVLKQLQTTQEDIKNQNDVIKDIVTKLDTGVVTREELAQMIEKLGQSDSGTPAGTNLESGGPIEVKLSDDVMEMVGKANSIFDFITDFANRRKAQGLEEAVPVAETDYDRFIEFLATKAEEEAQKEASNPERPIEGARVPASEGAYDAPPEAISTEEAQQVDQPVEEPPAVTEKPVDERVNIYGEDGRGVYVPTHSDTDESGPYVDNDSRLDFALDDWLNRLPHLTEYTRQHPDALRFLSMEGDDGKTVHQTLKDAIFRSFDQGLFEGQSASNIMAMMDEFLSQTSRDGLEQAVKEWEDLTDGQRMDPEKTRLQKGVIENVAGMAETALGDVFREDFIRRRGQPPADADIRTNGYAATDDLRRTMRVVAGAMAEEEELRRKGLGEDQIKARMEQEDKAQRKASEQKAESIVKDLDPQIGNVLAMNLRDKLFYSSRAPAWSDYRSILDSLGELREKYPGVVKDINDVRDDIVLGMIVPQLMGFKNIANVSPSDTLTKDKIEEISRRAMEFGLAKRQEVTDRVNEATLAGKDYKFSKEDEYWLGFPTVDELVNSHIYGRNSDKDPVNINRARVHRQEGGNRINNRLGEAFRAAAKDITLNDLAQSKLEDIRNNNLYSKFQNQIAQVGAGADRLPSADDLWARYKGKDEGLTIADVNTTLGSYRSAIANASDLKKKIEDYLSKNGLPREVSNEYGKMEVPQGILQQMENARADHAKAAGMGNLDKFFAEGDVSKQLLSLEALKEQMYEDDLKKNYGFDDETVKKIIDKAHKKAGDSGNYEAHIGKIADTVVKERKKAEKAEQKAKEEAEAKKRFEDNSDSAKAKLEEIRNGLLDPKVKSAMDGVQRLEGEDDRKFLFERTVTGLRQIFKDNASLSAAGEALGLKEPGTKDWNINAPNPFTYIANALINGSGKLTDRKYDSVWPPKEESKQEEDAIDEVDDSQLTDGLDPNVIFD